MINKDMKDQTLKTRIGSEHVRAKVADIIRTAREQKGWSRYELAKRAEIGETHLAKIEEGTYAIRVDIFNHLCSTLGIKATFPVS